MHSIGLPESGKPQEERRLESYRRKETGEES
jgi:hypothetical protein